VVYPPAAVVSYKDFTFSLPRTLKDMCMISCELQRTSYNLEKEGKREQIDSQMKKGKKEMDIVT
jgi:hypothetical protein